MPTASMARSAPRPAVRRRISAGTSSWSERSASSAPSRRARSSRRRVHVDGDDPSAAGRPQRLRPPAGRSCPRRPPRPCRPASIAGAADGVHGDRERLDHGRLAEAHALGQPVEDVLRHGHELGEGPVPAVLVAGDAQHAAVVAEVDLAARGRTSSGRSRSSNRRSRGRRASSRQPLTAAGRAARSRPPPRGP